MSELFLQFFHDKSSWELCAVALSLAYLLLAMRENIWCWPAALISTVIYTWLFWHVALLMDSALNVYYMLMAIYGWWLWRAPRGDQGKKRPIVSWSIRHHIVAIAIIMATSSISAFFLARYTQAAWPFWDSFTTWASVLTTIMVAQKVLENWLYWIVIDAVAMVLYIERGLYPTAMLFGLYTLMVVGGYIAWRRLYYSQSPAPHVIADTR